MFVQSCHDVMSRDVFGTNVLHPEKFHTSVFIQTPFVKSGKLIPGSVFSKNGKQRKVDRFVLQYYKKWECFLL